MYHKLIIKFLPCCWETEPEVLLCSQLIATSYITLLLPGKHKIFRKFKSQILSTVQQNQITSWFNQDQKYKLYVPVSFSAQVSSIWSSCGMWVARTCELLNTKHTRLRLTVIMDIGVLALAKLLKPSPQITEINGVNEPGEETPSLGTSATIF